MRENMTQLLERLAAVTAERDRLAAELAKLRAQEPVAYLDYWKSDGTGIVRKQRTTGVPFYNSPVPALAELDSPMDIHDLAYELGGTDSGEYHLDPEALDRIIAAAQAMAAVPDWNVNIQRIRDVMHMLGISIEESVECFYAALPTNINRMTLAMKRHLQKLAGMTAITPTPFIPDDDTRRNDEAFAAQQAATAPSVPDVPDEWREVMAELAADLQAACDAEHPHRDQYPSIMRKYQNDMRIVERARALLQSANHSERNLEKVSSTSTKDSGMCEMTTQQALEVVGISVDGVSKETLVTIIRRLQAENERLRKDAERYQWLSNDGGIHSLPYDDFGCGPVFDLSRNAIDAARGVK